MAAVLKRHRRYWLRRHDCWGGTYVWSIDDTERDPATRAVVCGRKFRSERQAAIMRDRAEQDWQRYLEKRYA